MNCHLHVVSVNWSKDLIRSVRMVEKAQGQQRDELQALRRGQEEEEEEEARRSSLGKHERREELKFELHSPNLLFEDGVSIGRLSGEIEHEGRRLMVKMGLKMLRDVMNGWLR